MGLQSRLLLWGDDKPCLKSHRISGLDMPFLCRRYRATPCVAYLRDNGAEIFHIEDEYPRRGQFQRFLVMNDRTVGRFLIRDCDARLSLAEAKLVQEWIDSRHPFHVMRDHILHNALMMAGLWGGRTDTGIDIVALIRRYFPNGPPAIYGDDQRMLGSILWPLIRGHCLVHDRHYHLSDVHEVRLPELKSHFGAGYQNLAACVPRLSGLTSPRTVITTGRRLSA